MYVKTFRENFETHNSPCDFFVFLKLKLTPKGRRFDDIMIQEQLQNVLAKFKKQDFFVHFQQFPSS
jgi:hypothetical protein